MKHRSLTLATAICLLACMAGCGQQPQISAPQNEPPTGNFQTSTADSAAIPSGETQSIPPAENTGRPAGKISAEDALAIALDNAGVPEDDAYNIKNEKDSDNGIPLYDIEFETDYGDYDCEVAIADGRIVGGTTRWMRNGWTLWEVALSPWRRPQSLLLAKSPALMRQTYLFGRSLKMAGTATRGSCFLKI